MRELYNQGKEVIRQSGIENPELEAFLLLAKALSIEVKDIYSHPEREFGPEEVEEFNRLLERRIKREPMAYILGEKEFYSRSFLVTPDVLIPRPETEVLVEEALKILENFTSPSIIDVGTGSGCIAVTLGSERQDASIFATDISYEAILIARKNAKRHGVSEWISFICAHLLGCFKDESFDLVVSNPPYVKRTDYDSLDRDVRDYEPKLSLLGGEEGIEYIKEIILQSKRALKKDGWCIIEVGVNQSDRVIEMFAEAGFKDISLTKDLSGIERVIKGKWIR
ncbi:MAG TPA: peptide chain release factor N(5)-glutamine methyltransferase [Thermodesulfobacteriota bacterium]|nr:peptide chain release factor N(5)-glutamine methyltransferase [Thermodesulfobacteriota bacterium]